MLQSSVAPTSIPAFPSAGQNSPSKTASVVTCPLSSMRTSPESNGAVLRPISQPPLLEPYQPRPHRQSFEHRSSVHVKPSYRATHYAAHANRDLSSMTLNSNNQYHYHHYSHHHHHPYPHYHHHSHRQYPSHYIGGVQSIHSPTISQNVHLSASNSSVQSNTHFEELREFMAKQWSLFSGSMSSVSGDSESVSPPERASPADSCSSKPILRTSPPAVKSAGYSSSAHVHSEFAAAASRRFSTNNNNVDHFSENSHGMPPAYRRRGGNGIFWSLPHQFSSDAATWQRGQQPVAYRKISTPSSFPHRTHVSSNRSSMSTCPDARPTSMSQSLSELVLVRNTNGNSATSSPLHRCSASPQALSPHRTKGYPFRTAYASTARVRPPSVNHKKLNSESDVVVVPSSAVRNSSPLVNSSPAVTVVTRGGKPTTADLGNGSPSPKSDRSVVQAADATGDEYVRSQSPVPGRRPQQPSATEPVLVHVEKLDGPKQNADCFPMNEQYWTPDPPSSPQTQCSPSGNSPEASNYEQSPPLQDLARRSRSESLNDVD